MPSQALIWLGLVKPRCDCAPLTGVDVGPAHVGHTEPDRFSGV